VLHKILEILFIGIASGAYGAILPPNFNTLACTWLCAGISPDR